MDAKQLRDRLWWTPPEAAFGGHAERPVDGALGRLDPALRALLPIRVVDQSKVELSPGRHVQILEGRKVGVVGTIAWNRKRDPLDGTLQFRRDHVGNVDQFGNVRGFLEVLMAGVAITEGISELDVSRNPVADANQAVENFPADVRERHRPNAFQHAEFDRCIPLDGELIMGDGSDDLVKFAEQSGLVRGFHLGHCRRRDEGGDGCQRRRETDLETDGRRDLSLALEGGKLFVGCLGGVGVAKPAEPDLAWVDPGSWDEEWQGRVPLRGWWDQGQLLGRGEKPRL